MKRVRIVVVLFLTILGAAPVRAAGNAPTTAPAAAGGVQQLNDAFLKALASGDIEGVMKLYAADAVLFPPGEKVARGQDEIRFKWKDLMDANTISDTGLKDAKYVGSPTVSAGWGNVTMKLSPKNGKKEPKTIEGRFSTIAEKRNGKWAYVFVGIGELDEILTLEHYSKTK